MALVVAGGAAILMCYGGWPIFVSLQWYRDRSWVFVISWWSFAIPGGRSSSVTSMVTKKQIKSLFRLYIKRKNNNLPEPFRPLHRAWMSLTVWHRHKKGYTARHSSYLSIVCHLCPSIVAACHSSFSQVWKLKTNKNLIRLYIDYYNEKKKTQNLPGLKRWHTIHSCLSSRTSCGWTRHSGGGSSLLKPRRKGQNKKNNIKKGIFKAQTTV